MFWISTNTNAITAIGIEAFVTSIPVALYPSSVNPFATSKTPELAKNKFCP